MAILDNPKHEAYAGRLARNIPQGKAYEQSGYTPNAAAASRLAATEAIKERTEELRLSNNRAVALFLDDTSLENAQTLADMGLTREWCAAAFHGVYEAAIEDGKYSAANAAIINIQKMIDVDSGGNNDGDPSSKSLVDLSEITKMLAAAKDLMVHETVYVEVSPGDDAKEVN